MYSELKHTHWIYTLATVFSLKISYTPISSCYRFKNQKHAKTPWDAQRTATRIKTYMHKHTHTIKRKHVTFNRPIKTNTRENEISKNFPVYLIPKNFDKIANVISIMFYLPFRFIHIHIYTGILFLYFYYKRL